MKVLHLNLSDGGIGRYGALLAAALARASGETSREIPGGSPGETPGEPPGAGAGAGAGVEAVSLLDASLWDSPVFGPVLREAERLGRIERVDGRGWRGRAAALAAVRRLVRLHRPDVVHDSAGGALSLGYFLWGRIAAGSRLVLTEHDPLPHSGMGASWAKRRTRAAAEQHATAFIVHGPACAAAMRGRLSRALSPSGKRKVESENAVGRGRVQVVPHGEMSVFGGVAGGAGERENASVGQGRGVEREAGRVLFFGALRPNKGVAWLPQIVERVGTVQGMGGGENASGGPGLKPSACWTVAGSPRVSRELMRSGWPGQLRDVLDRLRGRGDVEVMDRFVGDEAVGALFAKADVTLLPYADATQSGVALAAMPLGSVVVATRVGDLPDVIEDGVTGFLAEADPGAIAAKLVEVLSDRDRLERVRAAAMRRAREQWSWTRIAERTAEVYRGTMG